MTVSDIASGASLSWEERSSLAEILAILIPGGDGMPAAVDCGVHNHWVDEALRVRPELRCDLDEVLAATTAAVESVEASLRALAETRSDVFARFGSLVAGAYYMDDDVRRALGYPGQEARVVTDETDAYLDLLERVVERGEIYRPTPETNASSQGGGPEPARAGSRD